MRINEIYSSNINEVIRAIISQFIFFYKKILHAQKHSQAKINWQNRKTNIKQQRQQFFAHMIF